MTWTVGLVGLNIGPSHLVVGYAPNPAFRVATLCDLDEARLASVGDEFGLAGKFYAGSAETFWNRGSDYYAVPWRGKWATELGGVLVTHALHLHDMALLLAGPASHVFGRVTTRVNPIEVEDCASVSVSLRNGGLLSLTCALGSQTEISRLRLHFENITFESNHAAYSPGNDPWQIIAATPEVQARIDALLADWQPVGPRFTTQMAHFAEALDGKRPLPVTTADARAALELVTAIYQSSDSGIDVPLPIGPDSPRYANWQAQTR